jgi:preprotein translocase subunit SecE
MKDSLTTWTRDVGNEMKKVSWPSRAQLQESTLVTVITCLIISVFVFVIDQLFTQLFGFIF